MSVTGLSPAQRKALIHAAIFVLSCEYLEKDGGPLEDQAQAEHLNNAVLRLQGERAPDHSSLYDQVVGRIVQLRRMAARYQPGQMTGRDRRALEETATTLDEVVRLHASEVERARRLALHLNGMEQALREGNAAAVQARAALEGTEAPSQGWRAVTAALLGAWEAVADRAFRVS